MTTPDLEFASPGSVRLWNGKKGAPAHIFKLNDRGSGAWCLGSVANSEGYVAAPSDLRLCRQCLGVIDRKRNRAASSEFYGALIRAGEPVVLEGIRPGRAHTVNVEDCFGEQGLVVKCNGHVICTVIEYPAKIRHRLADAPTCKNCLGEYSGGPLPAPNPDPIRIGEELMLKRSRLGDEIECKVIRIEAANYTVEVYGMVLTVGERDLKRPDRRLGR